MTEYKHSKAHATEWFVLSWDNALMACCDCGLAHEFSFKVVKGKLYATAARHGGATRSARKKINHSFKRIK